MMATAGDAEGSLAADCRAHRCSGVGDWSYTIAGEGQETNVSVGESACFVCARAAGAVVCVYVCVRTSETEEGEIGNKQNELFYLM